MMKKVRHVIFKVISFANLIYHDNQLKWHLYGLVLGFLKIIEISKCKVSDWYIKAHFVYAYIVGF